MKTQSSLVEDHKNKLLKVDVGASPFIARTLLTMSAEGQPPRFMRNKSTPIIESAKFLKQNNARMKTCPKKITTKTSGRKALEILLDVPKEDRMPDTKLINLKLSRIIKETRAKVHGTIGTLGGYRDVTIYCFENLTAVSP